MTKRYYEVQIFRTPAEGWIGAGLRYYSDTRKEGMARLEELRGQYQAQRLVEWRPVTIATRRTRPSTARRKP